MLADWEHGPHLLACGQAEYIFGLAAGALAKDEPDGLPPAGLAGICDGLLEASVSAGFRDASARYRIVPGRAGIVAEWLRWFQIVTAANPLRYCAEGVHGAMVPGVPHIAPWICIVVLLFAAAVFTGTGIQSFRRRALS